eukprot:jgi/Mesvir1/4137/Mv13049-RA.1
MAPMKLSYFDLRGRAEPIRLALSIAGIEFQDDRVSREHFPEMKPSLPFGSLPVLEIDGTMYAQSNALLRYVGRLTGLYPQDPLAALKVDQILDGFEDASTAMRPSLMETDNQKKLEMRQGLIGPEGGLTRYIGAISRLIGGDGYAVGNSLTIADLVIYNDINWFKMGILDGIPSSWVDSYQPLMKVWSTVARHPKVQAWEAAHK